ncbi:MAG: type I methionyl aminopeptidase [Ruminococcus sp.]|nr:type I methionyl aminopeptidase [Ruminococcus sp.]
MSVTIKSKSDLLKLREAGRVAACALEYAGKIIHPGMTTKQLDKSIHDYIVGCGAVPTFLGYGGFPASACISINDEVIHGIPSPKRIIHEGDIVSVDVGATLNGFVGDTAYTFVVGNVSQEAADLLKVTQDSLYAAIAVAKEGARLGDVSHTVEDYCASRGYGIVRNYCGHGIGHEMHEDPEVPNFGKPGHGMRLRRGMTFCIEPMINGRGDDVRVLRDGWTVVTKSGSLAAHFEHEIAVTQDEPLILTRP